MFLHYAGEQQGKVADVDTNKRNISIETLNRRMILKLENAHEMLFIRMHIAVQSCSGLKTPTLKTHCI